MTTTVTTAATTKTRPTKTDTQSASAERAISRRWEEWRPFAELRASSVMRSQDEYSVLMNLYRVTHRRRMLQLMAGSVRLGLIERDRLDDPLESEFNAQPRIVRAIRLHAQHAKRYDSRIPRRREY